MARKYYHDIWVPTVGSFKAIIRSNVINDCSVILEDTILEEQIFVLDIIYSKGKSTQPRIKPVQYDTINIAEK